MSAAVYPLTHAPLQLRGTQSLGDWSTLEGEELFEWLDGRDEFHAFLVETLEQAGSSFWGHDLLEVRCAESGLYRIAIRVEYAEGSSAELLLWLRIERSSAAPSFTFIQEDLEASDRNPDGACHD